MVCLALVVLLNVSPAVRLTDNSDSRHFVVTALQPAPLVDTQVPSLETMTREQRAIESRRMERGAHFLSPGWGLPPRDFVGPLNVLGLGVAHAIAGGLLTEYLQSPTRNWTGTTPSFPLPEFFALTVTGGLLLGAGAMVAVVAVISLARRIADRVEYLNDLERSGRMEALDSAPVPPAAALQAGKRAALTGAAL
jgi:hypothetical protein